jgi:ATP-dependent RNA helicase DOB1
VSYSHDRKSLLTLPPLSFLHPEELRKEEEARSTTVIPDEPLVAEYYEYRQQLDQMAADFREVVTHPTYSLPFLQAGRLVKVKYQNLDFGWGAIVNYQKRLPAKVCSIAYLLKDS